MMLGRGIEQSRAQGDKVGKGENGIIEENGTATHPIPAPSGVMLATMGMYIAIAVPKK